MSEVATTSTATADSAGAGSDQQVPVPLLAPREGLPEVVADEGSLAAGLGRLAAGRGPVALDTERASGYRYSQRAYLLQLRREGSGTLLIDPIACPRLDGLARTIGGAEWVLHAASQDLPCLGELGLAPDQLFDTELAGRLLNYPKVGLGTLLETILGYTLEKGHSAADWSTRPLPSPWLVYAALDVELLLELRGALENQLREAGKLDWAREEFAALTRLPPPVPRRDPWRRTSGIHRTRNRRQLGYVRELWTARDEIACRRDQAPTRVLPDAAIIDVAGKEPASRRDLAALPTFRRGRARRNLDTWWAAAERARQLTDDELPPQSLPYDGPPPARAWSERDPVAAERLRACRAAVSELATAHELPAENLLAPDTVRRLAWEPPVAGDDTTSATEVGEALREYGARSWQVRLTAGALTEALDTIADQS